MKLCITAFCSITLLTTISMARELSYTCSLPPLKFNFYIQSDDYTYDIEVVRGDLVDLSTQAEVELYGSGVCRHRVWNFDYNGPISIRELGCYGEIEPPKDAVGEISFDSEAGYRRMVFCY